MSNLFDLPKRTEFGRVVPKNAFDKYTTSKQKKDFADTIKRITWTHKVSTETTNLKFSNIQEIEFFKIELKLWKPIDKILDIIDKAIPYHIVFLIVHEEQSLISTTVKHPHPTQSDTSVIEHRFNSVAYDTQEEIDLSFELVDSIDQVYTNICKSLSRTELHTGQKSDDFIEREKRLSQLEKEIARLKSKIRSAKQFNIKAKLNDDLNRLKKELLGLKDQIITKSDFKVFQSCPEAFWLYKKDKAKIPSQEISAFAMALSEQGDRVEEYARLRFPGGKEVTSRGSTALEDTLKCLEDSKIIFQPSFSADNLYTRCDVIKWNEKFSAWDIYEIKASTYKEASKSDHYWDIAFQREVLRKANIKVGNLFLVELNSKYKREGKIDVEQLFIESNITTEVETMKMEIQTAIGNAKKELRKTSAPGSCTCKFKTKAKHCMAFEYFNPQVPSYSIYDISRVSSSKIENFLSENIQGITDIHLDSDLTDIQFNQVLVNNQEFEIIDVSSIANELEQLVYPIYFLDYETYPGAIPAFEKSYPYQQVPFQYSLHIAISPDDPLIHKEYLHLSDDNPLDKLPVSLRSDIGDSGSIIVWNKSFESKVNKDLAAHVPELEPFLIGLNERMYDLEDIFRKQYVVKKEFKGRTSIKYVLPAIVPDLSYKSLSIQDGGSASSNWNRVYFEDLEGNEAEKIISDLLEYCKLDTLAMVEILQWLRNQV